LPTDPLLRSRLLQPPDVVSLVVGDLDELPPAPAHVHCPDDRGSELIARLRYAGPHDLEVHIGLEGCKIVTNGRVARSTWPATGNKGPELISQLGGLLGGFPPPVTPDE
jgi:hypothetical protein